MSANMKPQEGHIPQQRPKMNAASSSLTPEENETVFKLLGRKCQTLNTAVVQIYKTEGSAHSHWKKKHTGVVCFVKDSAIRSYFLRAYCLIKNELIWEHEVYDSMKIIKARPFLLTFEGQDGHVGLNFVSEEECESFYRAVDTTIETRNRKKLEKRSRPKEQIAPNAPQPEFKESAKLQSSQTTTDAPSPVQLRNHPNIGSLTITSAPAPAPVASSKNFLSTGFGLSSATSKDVKKRKVTKADISTPTNFVHLGHIGWDVEKGFDIAANENDDALTTFFAKAGVSENELKDRDTRAFIYDFVQKHNVMDQVKSERSDSPTKTAAHAPPPPVPSRHQHPQNGTATQRIAPPPPPPPARQPPPPVPTTVPGATRAPAPPSRPPPINMVSQPAANIPPPPPPPPPPTAAPPPPPMPVASEVPVITTTHAPGEAKLPPNLLVTNDTRNALMESIRKGTTLKKVDPTALSTGSGDSHSDLMSEIRTGTELKPPHLRALPTNHTDTLADALRNALKTRYTVMQTEDEDSEPLGNDSDWED